MATYKQTNNEVATYGESSPAVLALQKELNAKGANLALDAKYGPLTKAAFEKYNTSNDTTGNDTTESDINRYVRTANPNDAAITKTERKLREFTGEEPSLENIIEEKRRSAQGIIDSINAQFQKTLAAQGEVNEGLNARVKALNIGAGLGGSDFGSAAAAKQEKKNQGAIDLIEAEKAAKINEILTGVDSRASEEYRARREEYIKSLGDDLDRLREAKNEDRTRAKESIAGLASAGVSIDKLKSTDPDTYKTLLEEYGGSQIDLESAWNAALPDDQKVKYETQIIRGSNGNAVVLRYGVNPRTGTIDKKEYDLGSSYDDYKGADMTETADGVIYRKNKDGTLTPLTSKKEDTEDAEVTKELQDAQEAIDAGADKDAVRRMFLDKYPKKGDLFLKYTKQEY